MTVYLDASVIVPIFLFDHFTTRTTSYLNSGPAGLVASDFASAEFTAVVAKRARMGVLTETDARHAFARFDTWIGSTAIPAATTSADILSAQSMLRRLDLNLRAPDAIHLAITQRIGAELATLDAGMAENARKLGIALTGL